MKSKMKSAKSGQGNSITFFDEIHEGKERIPPCDYGFVIWTSATPIKKQNKKKTGGKV